MDRNVIKDRLNKLSDSPLRDIELSWIEIILDRSEGNRSKAAHILNISMTKMRRYITDRKICTSRLKKAGRPENVD